LEKARLVATDIDAIVFFSSTLDAYNEADDLARAAADLGLTNALPLGLTLGQCTNYSTALVVARGLIESSGLSTVLLLGSDRLDEGRASRVFAERISVYSDGVVSCIVTREPRTGFQIGQIQHQFLPAISRLDARRDFLAFLQMFSTGMREASRKLCLKAGLTADAYTRLIPANLNISVLRNFAELVGVPFERMYTDNVGKYGHTFAYDQLISLETLLAEQRVESGQRFMLVGVGGNYLFSALDCSVC
jgi:3-oxoacyl-[acyl-carrier-protein] synthase-3